ncbi:MAG: hypothetical protein NTU79_14290 [Planctomycetota bacterium]|nr:hypothetical protein [Planctomycetota bacterium]
MTPTPKTSQQDQALALTMPFHVESLESAPLTESSLSGTSSASINIGERTKRDRRRFLQAASAFGAIGYSEIFGPLSCGLADDRTKREIVESVDAAGRLISVSAGTFRLHQKVRVYLDDQPAKLAAIKRGHDVKLTVDAKDIKLVRRIDASGPPDEAMMAGLPRGQKQHPPKEGAFSELPEFYIQRSPCVHLGGREVFFSSTATSGSTAVVYTARRESPEGFFQKPQVLFPAKEFSITADRMLAVLFNGDALFRVARMSPDEPFSKPKAITDVKKDGLLSSPRLSVDGLKLHCDRQVEKGFEPVVLTRNSRHEEWGPPQEVEIPVDFRGSLRSISPIGYLSGTTSLINSGWAVACLHNQEKPGPSVFILREGDRPNSFVSCKPIKVDGAFVTGFSPDYCHRTGELFLMGIGPGKGDAVGFLFKVKVPNLLG